MPARVKQAIPFETMPIRAYASSVRDVEMPTAEQIENFANYVSHAHSWYKHLPLFPPGEMFYFFRDKYAACDVVEPQNGVAKIVKRTEPGFHYSDLPTEEFRTRVGCLGFSCVAGTSVRLNNGSPPRDKLPTVLDDDAVLFDCLKK